MKQQVALKLEPELLTSVDAARGDVPRNRWIERAIEAALEPEHVIRVPDVAPATPAARIAASARALSAPPPARPYVCPFSQFDEGCEWPGANAPAAKCPIHGRTVVPAKKPEIAE